MKCKKKGHLAFNCPPKYNCKVRKPPMGKSKPYNKNDPKTQKEESTALVKEFSGMVISTNIRNNTSYANNYQNKNTQELKIRCKYCYRVGHTDTLYRDKQDKRPPSMPQ